MSDQACTNIYYSCLNDNKYFSRPMLIDCRDLMDSFSRGYNTYFSGGICLSQCCGVHAVCEKILAVILSGYELCISIKYQQLYCIT